ncbi:AhpA/YtjB family protein [Psychrobium sp. 1_MG-2023]|uniref:AhpA/YtjB family protein n=1 Tax=Psychrobium sp. 1_MG-2023 TaxID=3062624 RepID=UPI000C3242AC|nr:AhpA/YtjB family protein [Psychrobium sp. 1_MG-2023]MDP2561807.1 AhpA/YtjB family protein [Psychrobium sp. 1_MG-2023]PKF55819.1 hypothetical protein CW748_11810 [Alteromonadales bacterium alter-6D02]
MKQSSLIKQVIIKRLSQLSLALLLVILLGVLLWHSNQQSKEMRQQQQQAIASTLKQQLALAATMGLKLNEQQQLQWLAQTLTESPLINGIWIHQANGTLMAESLENGIGDESKSVILAAEIRQDELLGYLRLSLDKDEFVQPIIAIQDEQLKWQRWSLGLAVLIGFLLARALSQKRANYLLRDLVKRYTKAQYQEAKEEKEQQAQQKKAETK